MLLQVIMATHSRDLDFVYLKTSRDCSTSNEGVNDKGSEKHSGFTSWEYRRRWYKTAEKPVCFVAGSAITTVKDN